MKFNLLAFFSGKIGEDGYIFSIKMKPMGYWQTADVGTLIVNSKTGSTYINIDADILSHLDKTALNTKIEECKVMIKCVEELL